MILAGKSTQNQLLLSKLNVCKIDILIKTIKNIYSSSLNFTEDLGKDIKIIEGIYDNTKNDKINGYETSVAPLDLIYQMKDLQIEYKYFKKRYNEDLFRIYFDLYRFAEITAKLSIEIDNNPDMDEIQKLKTKFCVDKNNTSDDLSLYKERRVHGDCCSDFNKKIEHISFENHIEKILVVIYNCLEDLANDIDDINDKIEKNIKYEKKGINVGNYINSLKNQKNSLKVKFNDICDNVVSLLEKQLVAGRKLNKRIDNYSSEVKGDGEDDAIIRVAEKLMKIANKNFNNIYESHITKRKNKDRLFITLSKIDKVLNDSKKDLENTIKNLDILGAGTDTNSGEYIKHKKNLENKIKSIENNIKLYASYKENDGVQTKYDKAEKILKKHNIVLEKAETRMNESKKRYNSAIKSLNDNEDSIDDLSKQYSILIDKLQEYVDGRLTLLQKKTLKEEELNENMESYDQDDLLDIAKIKNEIEILDKNIENTEKNINDINMKIEKLDNDMLNDDTVDSVITEFDAMSNQTS